jgi:hypothetical protein
MRMDTGSFFFYLAAHCCSVFLGSNVTALGERQPAFMGRRGRVRGDQTT